MIISASFFVLCALVLATASWRIRVRDPDATVTDLFDRLLDDRAVRLAVIIVWWWLGWHFLAGQAL